MVHVHGINAALLINAISPTLPILNLILTLILTTILNNKLTLGFPESRVTRHGIE